MLEFEKLQVTIKEETMSYKCNFWLGFFMFLTQTES